MKQRYVPQQIPTKDLVAYYKLWAGLTSATTVFDYSLGGATGTVTGTNIAPTYPGFSFNGTDDFIDVGNQGGAIKTIAMWVKATSIAGNDYPIDLNGTDYISIETGTVTENGFGGPETTYVDGIAVGIITAGKWHCITMTHSIAKTASDLDIGRVEGVGLFTGTIGDVMLSDVRLTAIEVKSMFELTRRRYNV